MLKLRVIQGAIIVKRMAIVDLIAYARGVLIFVIDIINYL